jgi:tetratricopeptide (TPR) repeat protein
VIVDAPDRTALLRQIAEAAEQLPAALVRASELLRALAPRELIDRCDRATRSALDPIGPCNHPLLLDGRQDIRDLSQDELTLLARLCAAGPLGLDELEARLPPSIDALRALSALCDRALLRSQGGRWTAPFRARRSLRDDPRFLDELRSEQRACIERARARHAQWRSRGESASLDAIERERAALSSALDSPNAAALEGFAPAQLALALIHERREGVASAARRIDAAMESLAPESGAWAALAVERARLHRLGSEWSDGASLLHRIAHESASPETRAAIDVERAFELRLRAPDEALSRMQRAHDAFAALGLEHERVQCVIGLGSLAFWRQALGEALAQYERAREQAATLGAQRAEATALTNSCLCHAMLGDDAAATAVGSRAIELFRALGDVGAEGTTLGHLGMIALQRARFDQAECRFSEAEALLDRAGYFEQWRYAKFNQVALALARGSVSEASRGLDRVESLLAMRSDAYVTLHVAVLRADILEAEGRFAEALSSLDRGLRAGAMAGSEAAMVIAPRRVRLLARLGQRSASAEAAREANESASLARSNEQQMAFALALGHAAFLRGEQDGGEKVPAFDALVRALAPAWLGLAARERVGESVLESTHVRRAAALYWADLDAATRTTLEWSARDPHARAVCLDDHAGVARLPGGARLVRAARRNAFQLLSSLARSAPAAVTKDALIESIWPGERMQRTAASNRLSNAVAQLRALCEGPLVLRVGERYHLPEPLAIVRSSTLDPLQIAR